MQVLKICGYTFVALFLVYSVVPNLLVRVFHWAGIWKGSERQSVALTFDDGPDPNYTPKLLDVLHDLDVKATFFVIAEKAIIHRDIIHRMIREGHEVQVHGWRHSLVPFLSPQQSVKQFRYASQMLYQTFGIRTSFYRPTWGLCNLATLLCVRFMGHQLVTWSIMVGDWRVTPSEMLLNRIVTRLHPGAVLVLHDSDETFGSESGAPLQVISMLPKLLEVLRSQGYDTQKAVDIL